VGACGIVQVDVVMRAQFRDDFCGVGGHTRTGRHERREPSETAHGGDYSCGDRRRAGVRPATNLKR
jgi:hypothetical protein